VLLGRRHSGHAFMPGKFVFPGGRLEPADARMPVAAPLHPATQRQLTRAVARPSASLARALALAAIRETYEETGLLIGALPSPDPLPRGDGDGAGDQVPNGAWAAFAANRILPDLSQIHFVARAITPPRRPRRFDTRFFAADATAIGRRVEGLVGPNSELVELVWMPMIEARKLDMPTITGVVLQELELRIAAGLSRELPVPFYEMRHRRFVRDLL